MDKFLPDVKVIREEEELVPGGDIRIRGNAWLRKAWQKSRAQRVPRESEFRRLVRMITERHSLCILVEVWTFWLIALKYDDSTAILQEHNSC